MQRTDLDAFGQMLDAVCSLLSRGTYQPNAMNTALFFRSLARYSLADVRAGFDAHVADKQRGRFVPVPADILAQIENAAADDGRPGAEAAWAMAMRCADERETVVWTDEMAQAWGDVAPLFKNGDDVGARMAFKEIYGRLVDEARAARRPMRRTASLGFDQDRRAAVLASNQHLLERSPELPLVDLAPRVLLRGPGGDALTPLMENAPSGVRKSLLVLRQQLVDRPHVENGGDGQEKARTAALREGAQRLTVEYQAQLAAYTTTHQS